MNREQEKNNYTKPAATVNPKLLELLWKLKEQYQTNIDAKIPLNKLIQNLDYRKSILNSALNCDDEKSRDFAWEILRLQKDIEAQQEFETAELAKKNDTQVTQAPSQIQTNNSLLKSRAKTQKLQDKLKNAIPDTPAEIQAPVLNDAVKSIALKQEQAHKQPNNKPVEKQTDKSFPLNNQYKKPIIGASIVILLLVVFAISLLDSGSSDNRAIDVVTTPTETGLADNIKSSSVLAAPATMMFRVHGSNTIGENLMPALLKAFVLNNGATKAEITAGDSSLDRKLMIQNLDNSRNSVELSSHGSSTGFKALLSGNADLGMSSRKIKDAEVEKLAPLYGNMISPRSEHIIGLDGLAIIVNPENLISALNTQQIAQLFSGGIKNWADLGGKPGPVNVYARESNSGTWDTFKSLMLKPNKTKLVNGAKRFESSSELSDKVSEDVGGIGFIALPYVRYSKLLAVSEGKNTMPIVPTAFTIGTEDYPLSRRLYLYLPQKADNQVKSFVEFVHTQAGQDIVQEHGFVSQNLYAIKPYQDNSYPKEYLALTKNAQRLSLNFRFNISSNELDNKANRDLNRVVEYLFKNKGHRVLLFGFTDSIGNSRQNLSLSQKRVQTIAQALNARGIYPAINRGFGEAIPIASNRTSYGRYKNRRVEVWIE